MTNTSAQQSDSFLTTIDPDQPIDILLAIEWLLTNGTGSFSSGTIPGINTRSYHGLLIAAAKPPLVRINMLAGLGFRAREAVPRLMKLLRTTRDDDLKEAIAEALGQMADESDIPELEEEMNKLDGEDWLSRDVSETIKDAISVIRLEKIIDE